VIVDTGDDLELPASFELHPTHDVHLPELHGTAPFPTTIVLALATPLLGVDEAMTDETAIDRGAPGKWVYPFSSELVTNGPWTPERMRTPEVHDAGFDRRRHLMGTAVRPGRMVDETAESLAGVALQPPVHGLAGHAIAQGDVSDRRSAKTSSTALCRCSTSPSLTSMVSTSPIRAISDPIGRIGTGDGDRESVK